MLIRIVFYTNGFLQLQADAGIDALIVDSVRAISESLRQ